MTQTKSKPHGYTISEDWNADGFVYLKRGNERRQIGQARATTVSITNDRRPSGITEAQALWNAATPIAAK